MIVKGYPHKPTSKAVAGVMKGFTDNPFLQKKHLDARKKASKLRHDFSGGSQDNQDNNSSQADEEQ